MRIGYARVSTVGQFPGSQEDMLRDAGCERIYTDHASGASTARPQLTEAVKALRAGDEFVVCRLDRLGRSVGWLIDFLQQLHAQEVEFVSLTEGMDTRTSVGRMVYGMAAVFAQFERDIMLERTLIGQAAARANGRRGGRRSTVTPAKLRRARRMFGEQDSLRHIADVLEVSRAALYRALAPEIEDARARGRR